MRQAVDSFEEVPISTNTINDLSSEHLARAEALLALLKLEKIEEDLYRGANEAPRTPRGEFKANAMPQRLFGGQVLAQALQAAYLSISGLDVHSLHAYFLRPGVVEQPVLYEVDRIRDGRSFATRRVVGIQHGQAIFSMSASFHKEEVGFEHAQPMPNVPPPKELQDDVALARQLVAQDPDGAAARALSPMALQPRPFLSRSVFPVGSNQWLQARRWNPVWVKFPIALADVAPAQHPNSRVLQHVLLAYVSDMGLVSTAALPVADSVPRTDIQMASLDHTIWLHRPELADDWLLMHRHTSVAEASRGLVHAEFFSRKGLLVASVTQEGLLRR